MKIASDKLFKVIQSMTKAEKRYFKLWILRYNIKQSRRSIELFNALNRQVIYDEEALLKMLKTPTLKKNLSVHKKLLLNDLLQSLRSQHINKHEEIKLQEQLDYVILLRNRNLMPIAIEIVDKIIASAQKNNFFIIKLKALELKSSLLHIGPEMNKTILEQKEAILDKKEQALQKLTTKNEVLKLQHQIHSFYNNCSAIDTNSTISPIKSLGFELKKHLDEETISCHIELQLALADYFYNTKAYSSLERILNKVDHYFNSYPDQIQISPTYYYTYLQKRIDYLYQIKDYHALKVLRTTFSLFEKNEGLPLYLKQMAKISQIKITTELILAGQESVKNSEKEWLNWYDEAKLNPVQTLTILNVLMSYYFIRENYQQALDLYLNVDRSVIEAGSLHNSLICKYIVMGIHFELGNIDVLSYWVRNIRYTLKKENIYSGHKKLIINFFQKGPAPLQEDYSKLFVAFSKLEIDPSNDISKLFHFWLISKVKRRKIAELYRNSAMAS